METNKILEFIITLSLLGFLLLGIYSIYLYHSGCNDCLNQLPEVKENLSNTYQHMLWLEENREELISIIHQDEQEIAQLREENKNLTEQVKYWQIKYYLCRFNKSLETSYYPQFKRFEPVSTNCRHWLLLDTIGCNDSESCEHLGFIYCFPYLSDGISCPYKEIGKEIYRYYLATKNLSECLEEPYTSETFTCLNTSAHNIGENCLMYDLNNSCSIGICPKPNISYQDLMRAEYIYHTGKIN